ncbi:hypothetical protein IPF86_04180 [Candidatus Nomurabacteria bacterium]|jgi:hypothetical protein|nr:MAG: hypothetical protein IPF86_04180 [Candidatus Nomurabacteria bacterium]
MDYKVVISIIAVALSFVGYGIYIRDILRRKTVPHAFTFLIWSIASSVTWALQVSGGAGVGAWITFAVSAICIFIFFLSLKYGEKKITKLDIIFLLVSLIALGLWLLAKQPVWSMILLVATDVSGFGPTIRKSWNKPFQENLFTWELTAFRHALGIIALEKFNILTLLYPITWVIVNTLFSIFLIVRRRQVNKSMIQK